VSESLPSFGKKTGPKCVGSALRGGGDRLIADLVDSRRRRAQVVDGEEFDVEIARCEELVRRWTRKRDQGRSDEW
jgi:hypothetical protein